MGLVGRREAIKAPTVGDASESTAIGMLKPRLALIPGRTGTVRVTKSSRKASPMSNTHTAHSDQANQPAVRWLIRLTPRPCLLVPSVTTLPYSTTVSQALRQTLRSRRSRANFRALWLDELLRIPLPRTTENRELMHRDAERRVMQ